MRECTIRFVGGPLHNQLLTTLLRNALDFPRPVDDPCDYYRREVCPTNTGFVCERYTLGTFVTERGARYYQYIHESLWSDGRPLPECYRESFAEFDLELGRYNARSMARQ